MITSKHTRCCRWVWGAVTKNPHILERELTSMQTDYSAAEIARALGELERQGYIRLDHPDGIPSLGHYRGYVALVPFVVQAPAWATL